MGAIAVSALVKFSCKTLTFIKNILERKIKHCNTQLFSYYLLPTTYYLLLNLVVVVVEDVQKGKNKKKREENLGYIFVNKTNFFCGKNCGKKEVKGGKVEKRNLSIPKALSDVENIVSGFL